MSIKLLFADDSVTMHKVIQLTLESEDIDLRVANDGKEALAAVGEEKPDVLIAEVAMPVMNGFELCRQIKHSPQTKHIPVILISGELEEYDEELGVTVGADAHITKPFKSSEFIETVKQMAESHEKAGMAESRVDTGENYRAEIGGRPDGITGQSELLELTPSQSAGTAMPQKTDADPDEEFEVIGDDTIDLDDDIEDESENENDILSDSLDLDGVDLNLEGMENSSTGSGEAGQSVDDNLDSVFEGLVAKDETESESPAAGLEEAIPETPGESDDAVQAAEPKEGEADGILDEVFKDEEIEQIDLSGEELEQADVEPEIVVDSPETEIVEAVSGEAVLDGLEEEQAALDEPEPYAEPVISETPVAEQAEQAAGAGSDEVLSDSIKENVRLFFETKADGILKEVLSESVDKRISGVLENRLEEMLKDEIASAVGKGLESAMPAMLKAVTEITSEITPKIAEEMIKLAIEQITKGDAGKPSV